MRLGTTLFTLIFGVVFQSVQSQNWSHHSVLDDDRRFNLYWNLPEENTGNSKIPFKVEIAAKGPFLLGFSPNGEMRGSDIVSGWIKDGEIYFEDRHAVAFNVTLRDDQQDYELTDAYENDNSTVFIFRRKLDTCDKNDTVIDNRTMTIIYAYSEVDPESGDPFYHMANRGVKSVLLLQKIIKEDPALNYSSLLHWDVMLSGIDFSTYRSLYWCRIFKTPQVSEKNHIVHVQPVFEDDHEQYIHHMAIFQCIDGTPAEFESLLQEKGHECWVPDMPVQMLKCNGFAINWAVGGEATVFPKHVGWPIYRGTGMYYMMQIHYNNPELVSGIDHSGFRLYYTPNTRDFDIGNIMIGSAILPRMVIPPRQGGYVVTAHTSPQCVPWTENGVKAIAVSPHAHITSRRLKLRHFRGNQELTPLLDDENYDFNSQDYRFYMKEIDILPGDQLTVECTFDTSERSNVTFGGQSTEEEMCMVLLLHYPLLIRTVTFSAPSLATLSQLFDANITNEVDVIRVLGSYDWTNADIDEVQNVTRYSEHETSCDFGEFPKEGVNPLVSYPKYLKPYEPPSTCNVTT